jgi:hypothetical protein
MVGRLGPQFLVPADGFGYDGAVAASFSARIDIDDLATFIKGNQGHVGRLSVELSIPVLSDIPFAGHNGTFELFRHCVLPAGGNGYCMVYDAEVTNGDRIYTMTARKYLKPRFLWGFWRLWPETTTLNVTLQAATPQNSNDQPDVEGDIPVVEPLPKWLQQVRDEFEAEPAAFRDFHRPRKAAGIVFLTAWEFARQIAGMRGIGKPWYIRWFAVLRFMAFFAGSLVRIYAFGE